MVADIAVIRRARQRGRTVAVVHKRQPRRQRRSSDRQRIADIDVIGLYQVTVARIFRSVRQGRAGERRRVVVRDDPRRKAVARNRSPRIGRVLPDTARQLPTDRYVVASALFLLQGLDVVLLPGYQGNCGRLLR